MSEHSLNINFSHLLLILFFSQWTVCLDEEVSTKGPSDSDYYILDDAEILQAPAIDPRSSSRNVSVSTGSRAFLHCTIDNAQRKTVSWVRLRNMSNPGLLAVGQFVFSSDSRIGVKISPATRQWQLSITNAGVLDSGWYECQVNTSPHLAHRVHLTVLEPRCEILGEKSVYLNVGSSHTINCTVLSPQPPDHIFWYFNSRPLPVSQEEGWEVTSSMESGHSWSSVRLLRVSLAQSGSWECRPSNCRADGVTMTVLDGELHAAMQANSATGTSDWLGGKFSLKVFCCFILELFLKIMFI